ncbi:MAG: hypothetical protein LUC33_00715 [Prevotellaceae bacterium]|nr:hypothetical protein [Prevotellaceae bacterium]
MTRTSAKASPKETADIVRRLKREGRTTGQAYAKAAELTGKRYGTVAKNYRDDGRKPVGGKGNGKRGGK